jgi:hypothetical protein
MNIKNRKRVTRKRIEQLAHTLSFNIKRNKKGEWSYFENGAWLDLGKNNRIAELNLIDMCKASAG